MSTLKVNNISSKSASDALNLQINEVSKLVIGTDGKISTMPAMASGVGVDFSADSKGVFKGLESIVWRMVNTESTGAQDPLGAGGSDWEIADDTENEFYLGSSSQITESSGVFSFGSTGYWLIEANAIGTASGNESNLILYIRSTDDNSTYSVIASAYSNAQSGYGTSCSARALIKVTNTSNDKIKLGQNSNNNNGSFSGSTTNNFTCVQFTKFADL